MSKRKHIHRYERRKIGAEKRYVVLRCNLPDCTHYIEKNLALGKLSICNRCQEPMVITRAALRNVKIHCINCTKSKTRREVDRILELIGREI